jgi:hypothetical protein
MKTFIRWVRRRPLEFMVRQENLKPKKETGKAGLGHSNCRDDLNTGFTKPG